MSQRFLAAQNTSSLSTWVKTLDELSRLFCVTRERIRQIQNIALRKLRLAMAN